MNGKAQRCKAVSGWDDVCIAMFARLANAGTCLAYRFIPEPPRLRAAGQTFPQTDQAQEHPAVFGQHDAGRNRISGNKEQCPQPVPLKICAGDGRE